MNSASMCERFFKEAFLAALGGVSLKKRELSCALSSSYSRRSAARSARTAMKQLPNNKGENCHPHSLEIRKSGPPAFATRHTKNKDAFQNRKSKTEISQKNRLLLTPCMLPYKSIASRMSDGMTQERS